MLVLQYYATLILESDRPGPYSQAVAACATTSTSGWSILLALHAIVAAGQLQRYCDYYWLTDGVYGHMTAKGNEHAANLVFTALRDWCRRFQAHLLVSEQLRILTIPSSPEHDPKSGHRFSEKIALKQKTRILIRFNRTGSKSGGSRERLCYGYGCGFGNAANKAFAISSLA